MERKKRGRPSQRARFIEKAKELGADESGKTFERALEKIVPPKKAKDDKPLRRRKA